MGKIKVFISSVQSEFALERKALAEYIRADSLLGKFFDPFIFEELPAVDLTAPNLYLKEVGRCNIYLGLIGAKYGYRDSEGVSPTEREYNKATQLQKTRLIFLTYHEPVQREQEVNAFIKKIEKEVVRSRFIGLSSLLQNVYHSLIRYLEENRFIQLGPFDAQINSDASLEDIDEEKVISFVRLAKSRRGFPLDEDSPILKILHHLNLSQDERLTNAALLLFGKNPQRFFPTATTKCAVFHGFTKTKPIPSYKIISGDIFEQINQAVEFVMSQLDFRIGTRSQSNIAPGSYEIPREVVTEGIVNAIVHRNYANNASVEVILYKDRLEISNPGSLPLGWTTERLKQLHNSVPHNPFIAHPMYLAGYIEQLGTGTEEMVQRMKDHGLPEPKFIQELDFRTIIYRYTPQATPQLTEQPTEQVTVQPTVQPTMQPTMQDINSLTTAVKNLIKVLEGAMSREELQEILELKNRDYFRINYINTALDGGWIEMTEVESNHPNQKYRLTQKGLEARKQFIPQ
ncbi:MAG TPA: ATP-binding protein, partial [Bacteroidales bacterium]|nr:ATP-binding protein [Bacteroidales bacterium]